MNLYRPLKIGSLSLSGNLFLAPVAGYTDRPFRSICVELGADLTYTELASSEALIRRGAKTFALLRRAENETRYAVQLFGSDPEVMYSAALLLEPLHPEVVDINAGCPVPKVVKSGAGSALMRDPAKLGRIVEGVAKASREKLGGAPVTVKMRSGWDASSINYNECARTAVEAGAALVCLHARTRSQGYSGKSNWEHLADLVSRLKMPVAGSGDLYSPEDAERMLRETGCAALMFARGAQGNPFIFRLAREYLEHGAWTPPSYEERFAMAFRQLDLLTADLGEAAACREMRRAFCAYTKGIGGGSGLSGGNKLRDRLVHAETISDYKDILSVV
ncbi:tRNA dihydrouridine synthase DusB [Leadbettera azotonutricia]|uniref:tRNA-dihydrouridine synthase n=1 Tax=Leadbettera azotonutricia (strain ATCC BAA-888 / DSM 13862 / ZAS-9) TaxID=545695 RepID=F5Y8N3_LEAAZ|nr:tRNA dihydrouridine synthase DusB [Leadbettera azotonutricia]AEF81646.1 tRNA-dihydrouridine synthase B [Leadbettera azotonutricia ZAS-9]